MSAETGPPGFELVYDPDPFVWLVGPTAERPIDVWVPGATDALFEDFGAKGAEAHEYIQTVLQRFASDDTLPLTERLLRWRSLQDDPFPIHLGVVERVHWPAADLDAFVGFETEDLVEPALIEIVDKAASALVRRGIGYSQGKDRLVAGVRYVIDDGDPDLLAVMMTATSVPGQLIEALEDFDNFARTVKIVRPAA